ncbi:MAG: hypothetical protein ACXACI_11695 [Candidatus Hodarchaeales archaeon]
MGRIAVIGIGHSRFGRRDDVNIQELAFEPFEALSKKTLELPLSALHRNT